ncbi:MAG: HAMP domain-containing sensor histidine kinase [Solirubrobacterales bacterium]
MPLSRRLVLILVAISALGLLTLGVVSYLALRSYLSDRVDQQARDAVPLVVRFLGPQGAGLPLPPDEAGDPGGGPSDGGPIGPQLPAGTYGQISGPDGTILAARTVSDDPGRGDGETGETPIPELPGDLPGNAGFEGEPLVDVPSSSGGSGFRVATLSGPGGETVAAAIPLTDLDDTLARVRAIELVVGFATLAALAALSWWAVRVGLRPLARIEETAGEIAAGDMSHRVEDVDERTEAGRLGIAFNSMLGRLEQAFDEQRASEERLRQFLADASHELRTPLSSIRGYAEVFRLGAGAEPGDLERSMRRIEEESERMSVLVDDLLTLARLDELREPRRERVDLTALAADAVADAAIAAPDRKVGLEAAAGVVVSGDPDQLRRLVANLLANAIAHGDGAIDVSVRAAGGDAVLGVRDHGPGLPDGAGAEIFGRFWRGGEARSRATGGAGLGLAIVAEVAAAHGGSVRAGNAPGGGARFEAKLPL